MNGPTHCGVQAVERGQVSLAPESDERTRRTIRSIGLTRLSDGFASGVVCQIDSFAVSGSARRAGARARVPLSGLAGGFAALVFAVTFHMSSVRAPGARAALETIVTLVALAAGWLLWAQFTSSRRLRDVLLVAAALFLGLTNFWVSVLPSALELGARAHYSSAEVSCQLAVGAILAAAAFTPRDRIVMRSAHPVAIGTILGVSTLVVAEASSVVVGARGATAASDLASAMARPLLYVVVLGPRCRCSTPPSRSGDVAVRNTIAQRRRWQPRLSCWKPQACLIS